MNRVIAVAGRAVHIQQRAANAAQPQALQNQQQHILAHFSRATPSPRRQLRGSRYHSLRCTEAAHSAGTDVASTALPDLSSGLENHTPVLLQELLECFREVSLHRFVDGTVGAGGHSAAIIKQHQELQQYLGIDRDQTALDIASPLVQHALVNGAQCDLACSNFRDIASLLARTHDAASGTVNGILLDLGVSSMQVDQPQRGFSFMKDGPLDMRMSQEGESAETLINSADEAYLGQLLRDYGEERSWRSIAARIVAAREEEPIVTTRQLAAAIGGKRSPRGKGGSRGIHPATRTFQALRIAVNDELGALATALPAAINCLAPGGRLAVISFHSLEDRVVKRAFLKAAGRPQDAEPLPLHLDPRDYPGPVAVASLVTRRPITAGEDEQRANPRSRSAKLRILQKL